jgi:hypothetical protein
MWLAAKDVTITCEAETGETAWRYCAALHALALEGETDTSKRRASQATFLAMARAELVTHRPRVTRS